MRIPIPSCLKLLLFVFLFFQLLWGYSQTVTKLFDFNAANGKRAYGDLISDNTFFYGTTTEGGAHQKGVVFKIKVDGTDFIKLHDFNDTDGAKPYDGLTQIGAELFGVTLRGGPDNEGVIFRLNTNGSNYTILNHFSGNTDGSLPNGTLYFDGTFLYGTTYSGGSNAGGGTIYKLKPDGSDFTTIHSFNGSNPINGAQPQGELIFDGIYFYGVTFNGGTNSKGIVYKIKPDGTDFTKLLDLMGNNGVNNVEPSALLLHNGFLYGCGFLGGANENGFIYRISTQGTDYMVLHDFDISSGIKPHCKLTFVNEYLYGTTTAGGLTGGGVLFKIKPDGSDYTVLYNFGTESGYNCWSSLLYRGNHLYGITASGGSNNDNGTIFQLDDGLPLAVPNFDKSVPISLHPNPVENILHISLPENKETKVKLYEARGRLLLEKTIYDSTLLDMGNFKTGVYIIEVGNKAYKILKQGGGF